MDREKFLNERKRGIGGSDAAAILGMSKWATPIDIYMEKLGLKDPTEETEIMTWGKILEPLIVEAVEGKFNVKVNRCLDKKGNEILYTKECASSGIGSSDIGITPLIAHVDGLFVYEGEACLLECKTVSPFVFKQHWNPEANQVPYEYFCQVQHYMNVMDLRKCLIAAWCDRQMHFFWVNYHEDFVEQMVMKEENFWLEHVVKKIPPPKMTGDDINKLLDNLVDEPMQADEGLVRLLSSYDSLGEEIKFTKQEQDAVKAEISNVMGNFLVAEWDGAVVAKFLKITQKRVDVKKLEKDFPDAHETCMKEGSYLRLYTYLEQKESGDK